MTTSPVVPAAAKVVPCLVVDLPNCAPAQLIHLTRSNGIQYTLVGLRLPPGARVYTPVDVMGKFGVSSGKVGSDPFFQEYLAGTLSLGMTDDATPPNSYTIRGDITPTSRQSCLGAGAIIATVSVSSAAPSLKFNLLISIEKPDLSVGKYVSWEEKIRQLFTRAYDEPALKVTSESSGASSIGTVFEQKC